MTASSPAFSPDDLKAAGITPTEYQSIVDRLGRDPNPNELAMFGVMWSEHCCYKNSRPLLKQFPTTGPRILVGPGENAGVVDLGDGDRLAFKIESHNHPSAVEPFQGAATGVGGILRDIFTMGARPIAVLNSLRFGPLDDPRNRRLFAGVVSGISHYGNCVGVPTVGGEVDFEPIYSGNPLVNAMALGLMETDEIVKSGAAGFGNPVLYVGSTTGRDGMGGASFASAELTDESEQDRPAVQVGDPFLEKSLIEACLEAFQTGAVVAAQDMGAAGITCSTSEMAYSGGVGIEFDLDKVPVRETGMRPDEFLLSESQERMLFVVDPDRTDELIEIFHRWDLHAVVAGKVIEEPIVRIFQHGQVVAEVAASALADDTPIYEREIVDTPDYAIAAHQWTADRLPAATPEGVDGRSWNDVLLQLLDEPAIASKQWVYRQYDHQVQNNTVLVPGGADAAVVRIRPQTFGVGNVEDVPLSAKGVAAVVDCKGRYVYLDPYEGAKAAVAEAARNLSCVGAEPLAVTDNLNFGSPEKPVGYWQLAESCRGISDACQALGTPVTGGNVSLYNETIDSDGNPCSIYPTPVVGMVGLVPDVRQVCGQAWATAGDAIYLLGSLDSLTLGGTSYLSRIHSTTAGLPPRVDLELEARVQSACRQGIRQGWIASAHDCSDGGLAIALAESCLGAGLGADIAVPEGTRIDECLFGEGGGRIIVSVSPDNQAVFEDYLQANLPNDWRCIGQVAGERLEIELTGDRQNGAPLISLPVEQLASTFNSAIPKRMQA
ncbi:MAG: phosphoribosylformylglycinamidine synthase subunit PurL [Cyanobacteria bacterium J06597_1]